MNDFLILLYTLIEKECYAWEDINLKYASEYKLDSKVLFMMLT